MKFFSRTAHTGEGLAATNILSLLDNQLILVIRAWGSTDYTQKFRDEVEHYLSSTQADLEVTMPFHFHENLTSLANRTRISLRLVHDSFLKNENKTEYTVGFEAAVLFKSNEELAWSSVGRFAIDKVSRNSLGTYLYTYTKSGSDLDRETLLPVQLIGIEKEIDISSGSIRFCEHDKIIVSSTYGCNIIVDEGEVEEGKQLLCPIDINSSRGAYWFSVISPD